MQLPAAIGGELHGLRPWKQHAEVQCTQEFRFTKPTAILHHFLVQKRNTRIPILETFDLPDNSTPCARRGLSTVAPQALTLLNSPLAAEAAHAFAARVRREAGADLERQIHRAFELALQRAPRDYELVGCRGLLKQRSLSELCRVLLNLNEFVYVD